MRANRTTHIIKHLLPFTYHTILGRFRRSGKLFGVLFEPVHYLFVGTLHLFNQSLRVIQQFCVILLNIFDVFIDAIDLVLDGFLLRVGFFLSSIPCKFLTELSKLFPQLKFFFTTHRIGTDTSNLFFQLSDFFLAVFFLSKFLPLF